MDIFKTYATDEKLENEGVLIPIGNAKFMVARSGNKAYVKALSTFMERNEKLLGTKGDESEEAYLKGLIEIMADTVLLDWEGVEFDGEPLPYNRENAIRVLSIKDFRREIQRQAEDIENFKAKKAEEQLGN